MTNLLALEEEVIFKEYNNSGYYVSNLGGIVKDSNGNPTRLNKSHFQYNK